MSAPTAQRRTLQFNSLDEVIADIEQLAQGEVTTTGGHSFPEIVQHLAITLDMVMGRVEGPKPPWYMRLMIPLMKPMIINDKPLKPGFNLPSKAESFFWPKGDVDLGKAIDRLKEATDLYLQKGPPQKHPMFGKLTRQQQDSMNLRHSAMHLSFVHPVS